MFLTHFLPTKEPEHHEDLRSLLAVTATAALAVAPAAAAETITYEYDARGRLTQVARNAGSSGTATTVYALDDADNRLSKTVTGAISPAAPGGSSGGGYRIIPTGSSTSGSPPPGVIVVPAGG